MCMKDVKYAGLIDGYNHKIHWGGGDYRNYSTSK